MSNDSLNEVFIILPDHIKAQAILEHIRELGKSGNLSEADSQFKVLCGVEGHDTTKAHAAWHLIRRYLNRRQIEPALAIYEILKKRIDGVEAEDIRAKAAFNIINMLVPDSPSKALKIWLELAENLVSEGVKWQAAHIGLFLLEAAFRNSDKGMAESVYQVLQNLRHVPLCEDTLKQADLIYQKKASFFKKALGTLRSGWS